MSGINPLETVRLNREFHITIIQEKLEHEHY